MEQMLLPSAPMRLGAVLWAIALARAAHATPAPAPFPLDESGWPIIQMSRASAAARAELPAGTDVLDVAVTADGALVLALVVDTRPPLRARGGTAASATRLLVWDMRGAPTEVAEFPAGIVEIEASPFGGTIYALRSLRAWPEHGDADAAVVALPFDARTRRIGAPRTIFAHTGRMSDLAVPYAHYDGFERVFFAMEPVRGRGGRVYTIRVDGSVGYEIATPDGRRDPAITTPALAHHRWRNGKPPPPARLADAAPLGLGPETGWLWLRTGRGNVQLRWGVDLWRAPEAVPAAGAAPTPAGDLALRVDGTAATLVELPWPPILAGAGGSDLERLELGGAPVARPVLSPNGRYVASAIGAPDPRGDRAVLVAAPIKTHRARVRRLTSAYSDVPALRAHGIATASTHHNQLHEIYEEMRYGSNDAVLATYDGLLLILENALLEAQLRIDERASRPRLKAALAELERVAAAHSLQRVREIAVVTAQLLDAGDPAQGAGEEGNRVAAGRRAFSPLHQRNVEFSAMKPQGGYTRNAALAGYFRALRYLNLLELSPAESDALEDDGALVAALGAWRETGTALVGSASRQAPLLATGARGSDMAAIVLPPYVRPHCVPIAARGARRAFPLYFGIDSAIFEGLVDHSRPGSVLADNCKVMWRDVPSGVELFAALGVGEARAIARAEGGAKVEAGIDIVARDVAPHLARLEDLSSRWLRTLHTIASEDAAPEGVDPVRWRRRLLETALGSWVGLRHAFILVGEMSAAELGGPGPFEVVSFEPPRGAVDPSPASWLRIATLHDRLAADIRRAVPDAGLDRVLLDVAEVARAFASMAERQAAGKALSAAEYTAIRSFGATVEHALLKVSAVSRDGYGLPKLGPMMKIAAVHSGDAVFFGAPRIWHVAQGRPKRLTVLLPDRGLLYPVQGATYSYFEVIADRPLDDADWQRQLDKAAPPAWVVVDRADPW